VTASKNSIAVSVTLLDPSKGVDLSKGVDPVAIDAFDHVHLYADSAKQSAFFLVNAFGFTPLAYRGPETGFRDSFSVVLKQGDVRVQISCPLRSSSPIAEHLKIHGFSAKDIAFRVPNAQSCYQEALKRGALGVLAPTRFSDKNGSVTCAAIRTYGDTIHTFIDRKDYHGPFLPGFAPYDDIFPRTPLLTESGLQAIDHVVGNVELGKMNEWVNFYERVLGFSQLIHFSDKDISTEYSALMSKVMNGGGGKIKLPINEPAEGRRKSQIEEYLEYNEGPGVQHIAFATNDIIGTVSELRKRGVRFLFVPKTYYDEVPNRVGAIKEDLATIRELGILVDRDEDGYLLQIFTKPLQDRPTLFFEIIQREGSRGFGKGNFKALFEAIERDQAERGNL
jgi:4-hydroxyphenylpyruvate dioxygenase